MDNERKFVETSMFYFKVFCRTNVLTIISKKFSDKLLSSWLFVFLPIVIYAINIMVLIMDKVFYCSENKFTYVNDLSNSLGFTLLFFISFFLSRYYPQKFDEWEKVGINEEYLDGILDLVENKIKTCGGRIRITIVFVLLFLVGFLSGYFFYNIAGNNENAFWIRNISRIGSVYYSFFLGTTWYLSLSLLGMAISGGFVIYGCIKYGKINYIKEDFNKNISIVKMVDIVLCNFSYGLFYIFGAFLFILNDKVAEGQYNIKNAFCDDRYSLILILIVLFFVSMAYMPLQELLKFMRLKKDEYISELNRNILREGISQYEKDGLIKKRDDIIMQSVIYTSLANRWVVILSILIPLIGIILQGIGLILS